MTSAGRGALFALVASLLACGGGIDLSDKDQPTVAQVHSTSYTAINVEVDYQVGAEPYVGSAGLIGDVWQIAKDNITRAFKATNKTATIPNTLAGMEPLTDYKQASFTSNQILSLAAEHRGTRSAGTTAAFYVVFLNGLYDDGTGAKNDILGVSLGGSGVIAIFKRVISGQESGLPGVTKVLEQSTLVHELGHAFGLVRDGVALTSAHEDGAHAHHCANDKCVMSWSAERVGSAVAVAKSFLATGTTVIYAADCLADLDAAK